MTAREKPDRAARQAAALRANLLKRKDQARRREEAANADDAQENARIEPTRAPSSPEEH